MEKDCYALFSAHHRRLLDTIEELGRRVEDDVLHTPELLTFLYEQLIPHARGEEATLYKRAETLPDGGALAQTMRQEHTQIKAALEKIEHSLNAGELTALDTAERDLVNILTIHNRKEEQVLYPMINQHLSPQERKELLENLQ